MTLHPAQIQRARLADRDQYRMQLRTGALTYMALPEFHRAKLKLPPGDTVQVLRNRILFHRAHANHWAFDYNMLLAARQAYIAERLLRRKAR